MKEAEKTPEHARNLNIVSTAIGSQFIDSDSITVSLLFSRLKMACAEARMPEPFQNTTWFRLTINMQSEFGTFNSAFHICIFLSLDSWTTLAGKDCICSWSCSNWNAARTYLLAGLFGDDCAPCYLNQH